MVPWPRHHAPHNWSENVTDGFFYLYSGHLIEEKQKQNNLNDSRRSEITISQLIYYYLPDFDSKDQIFLIIDAEFHQYSDDPLQNEIPSLLWYYTERWKEKKQWKWQRLTTNSKQFSKLTSVGWSFWNVSGKSPFLSDLNVFSRIFCDLKTDSSS